MLRLKSQGFKRISKPKEEGNVCLIARPRSSSLHNSTLCVAVALHATPKRVAQRRGYRSGRDGRAPRGASTPHCPFSPFENRISQTAGGLGLLPSKSLSLSVSLSLSMPQPIAKRQTLNLSCPDLPSSFDPDPDSDFDIDAPTNIQIQGTRKREVSSLIIHESRHAVARYRRGPGCVPHGGRTACPAKPLRRSMGLRRRRKQDDR